MHDKVRLIHETYFANYFIANHFENIQFLYLRLKNLTQGSS